MMPKHTEETQVLSRHGEPTEWASASLQTTSKFAPSGRRASDVSTDTDGPPARFQTIQNSLRNELRCFLDITSNKKKSRLVITLTCHSVYTVENKKLFIS